MLALLPKAIPNIPYRLVAGDRLRRLRRRMPYLLLARLHCTRSNA